MKLSKSSDVYGWMTKVFPHKASWMIMVKIAGFPCAFSPEAS